MAEKLVFMELFHQIYDAGIYNSLPIISNLNKSYKKRQWYLPRQYYWIIQRIYYIWTVYYLSNSICSNIDQESKLKHFNLIWKLKIIEVISEIMARYSTNQAIFNNQCACFLPKLSSLANPDFVPYLSDEPDNTYQDLTI